MFDEFLYNFYRSIRLDNSLYKDPKSYENISLYFAGIIIIINGLAGLIAQNTFIEFMEENYNAVIPQASLFSAMFFSLLLWIIWAALIYIIGGVIFPETNTVKNFKNILIVVGYGFAPGVFRCFAIIPELLAPIILISMLWIFASITIGIKEILNFRSNFKSAGVVILVLLTIFAASLFFAREMVKLSLIN